MAESDDRLWKLHLSKARGEVLTSADQADLDAWYAEQDQVEARTFGLARSASTSEPLKQQVDAVLERIVTTSQTIQVLAAENEILRREDRVLRQQLAQRRALQPIILPVG